jgi:hypothetical protein
MKRAPSCHPESGRIQWVAPIRSRGVAIAFAYLRLATRFQLFAPSFLMFRGGAGNPTKEAREGVEGQLAVRLSVDTI